MFLCIWKIWYKWMRTFDRTQKSRATAFFQHQGLSAKDCNRIDTIPDHSSQWMLQPAVIIQRMFTDLALCRNQQWHGGLCMQVWGVQSNTHETLKNVKDSQSSFAKCCRMESEALLSTTSVDTNEDE